MSTIFLIYRQDAGAAMGGRIYDRLVAAFGADALARNFDALPAGTSVERGLGRLLEDVAVGLVVVGPDWLAGGSAAGGRWLDDPADPTRLAIEATLGRGLPLLPILLDQTPVPAPAALPPALRDLVPGGGIRVRAARFEEDLRRLAAVLARWIRPLPVYAPVPPMAPGVVMPGAPSMPLGVPGNVAAVPLPAPGLAGYGAPPAPYALDPATPARLLEARRRQRRTRRLVTGAIVAAVLAVVLVPVGVLVGTVIASRNPNGPFTLAPQTAQGAVTSAAVAPDTHEVWGVTGADVMVHYADGKWTAIHTPGAVVLNDVALFSSRDGWAVGAKGVLLHYDGGRWTRAASPVTDDLQAIALDPKTGDGWIVGKGASIEGPAVTLRYSGGRWAKDFTPARNAVQRVALVPGSPEAWAANGGDVLHYQDGIWRPLDAGQAYSIYHCSDPSKSEATADATYYDVSSAAPDDAWLAESVRTYDGPCASYSLANSVVTQYLLHYARGAWSRVSLPALPGAPTPTPGGAQGVGYQLTNVAMLSASEGWAFGTPGNSSSSLFGGRGAVVLHYTGGNWQVSTHTTGGQFGCLAVDPDGEVWALGQTVLHYQGGAWSTYDPKGVWPLAS